MSTVDHQRTVSAQLAFSLTMVGVATMLLVLVWLVSATPDGRTSVEVISGAGAVFTAAGLVAALWRNTVFVRLLSGLIALCGAIETIPHLAGLGGIFKDITTTEGGLPHLVGRPSLLMALFLLFLAATLPTATSSRPRVRLAALMIIRIGVWLAGFWQLSNVVLMGKVSRLFEGVPAAGVQVVLAVTVVFSAEMLMRGDRRWLTSLSGADDDSVVARLILPLTMVPIVGGYFTMFGVRLAGYRPDVGYLLDIELTAVALLLMGAWALRTLWRERQGRESLARTLELSPVIIRDRDGVIQYWPKGCQALYGWASEEALGRPAHELLRTQYPTSREDAETALARGGEWSGEIRQVTRDGATRWIAVRSVIQEGAGIGDLSQVVETHTDITDLKLTGAALRDSEDYLAQAAATYEIGIASHDVRTNRTIFSPELERMLGVPRGGFGGSLEKFTGMFLAEDRERSWRDAIDEVRAHMDRNQHMVRVRRTDGEVRELNGIRRYIYDDDGELAKAIGIYMDVTAQTKDRVELEARGERLIEMHSMLAHVSRLSAMGEMAAALAHELNQPLTAVGNSVGAIEMMLTHPDKPIDDVARGRIVRAAKHAQTQAVRAGEIVRRLREFVSRGEADTKAENLERLVDDALALALPNPASARVEIRLELGRDARGILADRVQIEQVLVNLIRNAVESMRDQETQRILTIGSAVQQDMVAVRVKDTGPGVSSEVADRLFSPFQSTKADGMGVGLSICRRIIEAHGGRMWLEPSDDGGADFRFTLTLYRPEPNHGDR